VLNRPPRTYSLPGGGRIQVRTEAGRDEFAVVLARELGASFPGWAQGSWILTRKIGDGSLLRIRVFLRSDPYTFVQFRPLSGDKCRMDVVLYDAFVVRSQPLPIAFERLLTIPVEEILRIAGDKFPRRYFDPDPDNYRDVREFIAQVRRRLPALRFRDDGAIDERGRYVFIDTREEQEGPGGLNCSGFVKWVIDGILRPVTGDLLPIEPLKAAFGNRGSSFTEPYESLRDPFFGLDWTRNLAARANTVLRSPAFASLPEFEVRDAGFSALILRNGSASSVKTYPGFLPNAGFAFEGIHPLLYTLAVDEPGRIYLVSINKETDPAPRLRLYFHTAVLVPFFTETGAFRVVVFESAEETSFTGFKNRYGGCHVNLVRIPVEASFNPGL
jgi:hypothetical protein